MGPIEQRQAEIEAKRAELIRRYPSLWKALMRDWSAGEQADRAWLTYAANYIFRTGGVRWALDPYTLRARLPEAEPVNTARDLQGLSFILLTHRHADHLDRETLRSLRRLPMRWVAPEFMLAGLLELGVPRANVLVPQVMQEFELNGIKILPFEGLHFNRDEDGELHGVPELGYRIAVNGKSWLFPGDTRDYNPAAMPDFGRIDTVFAHLWFGRKQAMSETPALLEAFCQFHLAFHPRRIVITHLEEVGRNAHSLWDERHFHLAARRIRQLAPAVRVEFALTGQAVDLTDGQNG